jgi:hypothetical protein
MPMPTWHGHAQRFYRLRDTSELTAVDVVVFQRSGQPSTRPRCGAPLSGRSPAAAGGCRSPCPWWPRRPAAATPWRAKLSFVSDLADLAAKLPRAERPLRELLDELGPGPG